MYVLRNSTFNSTQKKLCVFDEPIIKNLTFVGLKFFESDRNYEYYIAKMGTIFKLAHAANPCEDGFEFDSFFCSFDYLFRPTKLICGSSTLSSDYNITSDIDCTYTQTLTPKLNSSLSVSAVCIKWLILTID